MKKLIFLLQIIIQLRLIIVSWIERYELIVNF